MTTWYVYVLRCADDTYYTGCCTDLKRRLDQHNGQRSDGARYTRSRRPVKMTFAIPCPNRTAALVLEYAIKQLPRASKAKLCGIL